MKKNNIVTVLFPTLFIAILGGLCSLDNVMGVKSILILSLIFLLPLLFLIQGIKSAINNTSIIISIGVSTLSFIIFMFIHLNSSVIIYIFIYLAFEIVGYMITNFIQKNKLKNN